jgi:hypothetical protein
MFSASEEQEQQRPLDDDPALTFHETKEIKSASQEKVHAEDQGSSAVAVRVGVEAVADRAQLRDRAEHGA